MEDAQFCATNGKIQNPKFFLLGEIPPRHPLPAIHVRALGRSPDCQPSRS